MICSDDIPELGVRRDALKSLKYLSISWELGDLALKATGSNELLTLIHSDNLGLGDEIFGSQVTTSVERKSMLDAVRPEVLAARERFKRLYRLSVKDQYSGSTAVERHYVP